MPNTIKLKKYVDIINERIAAAAITPGMLIEITSADKVQAHSTASGNVAAIVALENELEGQDIDDAYAAADQVQCWHMVPGEEAYMLLADGETVAIGDDLASNGDGTLKKHVAETESWDFESGAHGVTVYPNAVKFKAMEAKTDDSSGAESSFPTIGYSKRIKVMAV